MKMNLKHRVLSIILALVMVLSIAPVAIFAEDAVQTTANVTVNNNSYSSFENAVTEAEPVDGVITYHIYGKVEVTATGWVQVLKDGLADVTAVKFVGETSDAEICVNDSKSVLADQKYDIDVSFEGLILSHPNGEWVKDLGHATNYFACLLRNTGAADNTVTYTNCTFPNGVCNSQYGKTVFDSCTFSNATSGKYNLWNYGGETEVKNSTFTGTRGIKTYNEGTLAVAPSIKIEDTKFNGLTEKAAIVASKATDITLSDVSAADCDKGFFQKDIEGSTDAEKITIAANGSGISGTFNVTAEKTAEAAKEEFNISAGTFTGTVDADYLADGCTIDENGKVSTPSTAVAKIGDVEYETLAEAIKATKDGDTVVLLKDVDLGTSKVSFYNGSVTNLTFDLGGHKITSAIAGNGTVVASKVGLVIKNGTIENTCTDSNAADKTSAIYVTSGGTTTLKNVTLLSNYSGLYVCQLSNAVTVVVNIEEGTTINGGKYGVKLDEPKGTSTKIPEITLNVNGGTLTGTEFGIHADSPASGKYGTVKANITGGTVSSATIISNNAKYPVALEVSGGTVEGTLTCNGYSGVAITGGTFNGEVKMAGTTGTISISGGTFKNEVSKDYLASGFTLEKNEDGTYGVKPWVSYVASVNGTKYEKFADALAAANAGETITLLDDVTVDTQIVIKKAITLDLGKHTLTSTYAIGSAGSYALVNEAALIIKNGTFAAGAARAIGAYAALTLDGATVTTELTGGHACVALCANDTSYTIKNSTIKNVYALSIFANNATVEITNSILTGDGNVLYHNGSNYGLKLTVSDTTITSTGSCGVYISGSISSQSNAANQNGAGGHQRATFANCTISGTNGIEVKYTDLTLDGCTVSTTEKEPSYTQDNNGPAASGFAVVATDNAMNGTTPKPEGTISITGKGTYTGSVGLASLDSVKTNFTDFTDDTIKISDGTFDHAIPAEYCAEGYIPTQNTDGTYGVKSGAYVAEYNGTKYESLQEAIDAASQRNGRQTEVKLLCDLTITETIVFAKKYSAGSVLLNLGGFTLTGNGCRALQINKGNLYLKNGTVTSTGIDISSSVIRIGSNDETYKGYQPMLFMQKDAKVLAPCSYGVTIFGSATVSEKLSVESNATIEATGSSPAISGNGGAAYNKDKGTIIVITGNAVVSAENNYAIYHPDNGTVSIESFATISGKGGIQMCSGTLTISGSAKIEALGQADHETGAAGPIYDVAAISVVNRSYPGGAPVVTIKGTPTITAVDGEVIHAYTWSNSAESEWAEAGNNINVSGGTYNKTFNEAFLTADSSLVASTDGGYTVDLKKVAEFNGTQYTSLAQAILDANAIGGTVKLLEDVTLTNSLGIGGSVAVTLNLNKKTLTLDGVQIYTQGSATVTINNGTIKRIDAPTSGSASNFAIQVMSGSSLTLGAGIGSTYKVVLESTYGIYNVGGTLIVRYATITTEGWSIAVSDSASKIGEVYVGRGMGGNTKTVITSTSGNVIGTMVNSKSNVTIDYGTLTSNGTEWDAGVVYWASEGTLTITGGIFNASSAEGSTAAAVYQKNGTLKISGVTTKLLGNNALVVKAGDGSAGELVTELSAGTYSTKPDESWVVDGKEIHETDDGLYKVEGPYVVEVTLEDGTVRGFDSWSKAFYSTAAQEHNATVKLLTNIETTSTVTTWATVTVDFNGYTLTVNGSGVPAITVLTKGTAGNVTLKDSVGGGGIVTTGVYGVTVRGTGATATVESGSYNCATSVVQVENGTAYIKGGTFKTEDESKIYLLNCIDEAFKAGTAKIEVTGGTFYGFDPSASPEGEGTTYVANGYVSANNGDGTYSVKATVTITVKCDPANAGTLTGGGKYAEGESVTVTATVVVGYNFVGWYNGDTLVSTDVEYTFTVTEDVELVAKFTSNEKRMLNVNVGGAGYVTAEYDKTSEKWTLPHKLAYSRGTYFTLTAVAGDGYTFLFWVNGDDRVVSDEATYSFYLGDTTTLKAWFMPKSPETPTTYYVTFRDKNDKIIQASDTATDGSVAVPTPQTFAGFTFVGWADKDGNLYEIVDGKITVAGDVTVYAKYEAVGGLTVKVNGTSDGNTYSYGDLVKVTADATKDVDGTTMYFSGWYVGDMLVSDRLEYAFNITGNVELTAKYEGAAEIEQNVILNITGTRTGDSNAQQLVMNVTWLLPSDCTLVEAGLVRTLDADYSAADDLVIGNADGLYVKRNVSILKQLSGTYAYTLSLGPKSAGKTVYACGYIIYRDAAGALNTVYTAVSAFAPASAN